MRKSSSRLFFFRLGQCYCEMQIGRFLMNSALDRFERTRNFSLNDRVFETIGISVDENSRSVRDDSYIGTGTGFAMTARSIAPKNSRPSPVPSSLFNVTTSIDTHKTRVNSSRKNERSSRMITRQLDSADAISRVSSHACDMWPICRY